MRATLISRFNPNLMMPETLENIFVQRQKLAEQIVELIRESATTPSKHYTLLIGPRGIGKTHFISLIYYRIRKMDDLGSRLLIAWVREEEWGISSFLDLLLRILKAIEKEYNDRELAKRIESLYQLTPENAERAAGELLKEIIGNRTLLLLMENLDEVFAGLDDDGQKQLRAYLQENSFCTIVATAQSLFNGVKLQTSPFYGFFRIRHLKDLTLDEAVQLLAKVAKLQGDRELESFIQNPTGRDRIQTVHYLAGGNPRVYVIFSAFLTRKSLDDLVEAFMAMLDDLTPYYQDRMKCLSPQQRKIVDLLCDRRHAITVKEISQRCFITHQTASSQLKKLLEMGYVNSESIGRESYYELREPLMRFCMEVKKQRGEPIKLFVDFLRLWYTPKELENRFQMLTDDAALEREYLRYALQLTEEDSKDPRVAAYIKEALALVEKEDFSHAMQVAEKLVMVRGYVDDLNLLGGCLSQLKQHERALVTFDKAIKIDDKGALAWVGRGLTLSQSGRSEEALASFDKVIELDPNVAVVWFSRGIELLRLTYYEKALTSFEKGIELDPNIGLAWLIRGLMLVLRGQYNEALKSWDTAIKLGVDKFSNEYSACLFLHSVILLISNHWDEGIIALKDALKIFYNADETDITGTEVIINNLFNSTNDTAIWKSRLTTLIEVYQKHQVLSALGKGLVESIPPLMSEMVSDKAAQTWLELWRELTSEYKEFQIPLRLLNAAVEYKVREGDRRVLLELAIEERQLLEPLLEVKD